MEASLPIIRTTNLSKYYGSSRGIIDINLDIREGEVFGFLGPNGAGKTTTIRLLLGLLKPTSGKLSIFNQDLMRHKMEILSLIGYLPGDLGLYGELTGIEFLQHLLKVRKLYSKKTIRERTDHLIEQFGINLTGKIKTYSKGMRQITGIIQAFCHAPKLLILDEPTTGLDPVLQETFYNLLFKEKKRGTTFFFSSHILKEVECVCDRAGIIREGRLIRIENIEAYRSLIGKKITLFCTGNSQSVVKLIRKRLAPENVIIHGERIEFFYSGDLPPLLALLHSIDISDLNIEPPTLEDYFLSYYKEGNGYGTG